MSSTIQVKIDVDYKIEGPNIVKRVWVTDIGKPSVYLEGFQYKFSKDLLSTTTRSLKDIFK